MAWSLDGDVVNSVHDRLVMEAGKAINAVCTDTTASPAQALYSLRMLRRKVEALIDTVEEDVKRWREDDGKRED